MASTTLAVTPIYRLGLTGRDKADCAAEASTFELFGRIAHDLILPRRQVWSYEGNWLKLIQYPYVKTNLKSQGLNRLR
jgi:hypothetical protein